MRGRLDSGEEKGVTFLQPTDKPRLNEPVGFLLLILGVCGAPELGLLLSLRPVLEYGGRRR